MKIWDRKRNIFYEEKEYGKKKLDFLYNTFLGRILLKLIFSRVWFSKLQAIYQNSKISKRKILPFILKYNIDMSVYENRSYNSFADFFKRKRDIKNESFENELIAIADSKLQVFSIQDNLELKIKQSVYSLNELIQDEQIAKKYKDGTCLIYRLSMDDYHRFMFLDDGDIINTKKIKGVLHTIRPISKRYNVFCQNSRQVTFLNTKNFGRVIQIEVGAMLVGKIVNYKKINFKRLEEKGYFDFGGSTIVQLFEKEKIKIDGDILTKSKENIETKVEIGMKIGEKYD